MVYDRPSVIGSWAREGLRLSGLIGKDYRSMGRCWGMINCRVVGVLAGERRLSGFFGGSISNWRRELLILVTQ
jgi:hypothetical protein